MNQGRPTASTTDRQQTSGSIALRHLTLDVRCFGAFEVRLGDRLLDWAPVRPRVRALMRYLAAHAGRPVHRERIVEALWPELAGRAGINNLQVAVSTLRTFLEPGVARGASRLIPRDGQTYRLAIDDGDRSDLVTFASRLAASRRALATDRPAAARDGLRSALDLYAGDLLPVDGPAEWVVPERERYRLHAVAAGTLLARLEYGAGRWSGAVEAARRTLDLDACSDDGWRVLIGAQRRAGDPAAANRSLLSYRRMLHSLGIGAAGDLTVA